MPAITDAHLHLMSLVLAEWQIDLGGQDLASTLDAIARRDRDMRAAGDAQGWLLGHGWSMHDLGGWPDADMLERVAPGQAGRSLRARPPCALGEPGCARASARRRCGGREPRCAGTPRRERTADRGAARVAPARSSMTSSPSRPTSWSWTRWPSSPGGSPGSASRAATTRASSNADTQIKRGPLFYRRARGGGEAAAARPWLDSRPQLDRAIELGLRSGERTGRARWAG